MANNSEVLSDKSKSVVDRLRETTRPRRRWLRFSLRTMLLLVTALSVWLGVKVNQARRQKEAVTALRELGATIYYAHQRSDANPREFLAGKEVQLPRWLRDLAGDDFFQEVAAVQFSRPVSNDDLVHLEALPDIESLGFLYFQINRNVTDAGLNITDAGLAHLPRPDRLIRFHANKMAIGDEFFERLANASQLQEIVLGDTNVTAAGLGALRGLASLRLLSIVDPQLEDAALEVLPSMPSLNWLSLKGWGITDAGLVNLARYQSLTTVSLANTAVSDAGLEHLSELSNLRALDLEGTNIRGPGLRHIAPLVDDWLSLKDTAADDAALAELKTAQHLQCLNLEDTAITDAGLVHLYGLPKLNLICLEGTQVTRQGIAALNKAMPQLGIVTAPAKQ